MEHNRVIVIIAGSHGIIFPPMQMDVSWTSGNTSQGITLDEENVFFKGGRLVNKNIFKISNWNAKR